MKIKNFFGHLKTVCKHKYWVGKYCFKIGLYKQGITHDLSKFSPINFGKVSNIGRELVLQ